MAPYQAKEFFTHQHDVVCNQKYNDTLPYSFHLEMVDLQYQKFKHIIPAGKMSSVHIGIWGHDSIEDARLTFNNIVKLFGSEPAEIIMACTERWGHTREERHSAEYWVYMSHNKAAIFVKLCDIIANVKFSLLTNSGMYNSYRNEFTHVKRTLQPHAYDGSEEMFEYLEKLFTIN